MQDQSKPQPAAKIDGFFPIVGTIWKNQTTSDATGEIQTWYNAVERVYKDREGTRKTVNSYSGDELLIVAKVADLAHTRIAELRAADRAERAAVVEG